jgi:hypothetical protein
MMIVTALNLLNISRAACAAAAVIALAQTPVIVSAQGRGGQRQGGPAPARAAAPIDLTGYWVSLVTEDWRLRMVTPLKGDVTAIPLSPDGRKAAADWDSSKDGSCLAYGAGALMRLPLRVHITWESDAVLRVETDAGMQVRQLVFGGAGAGAAARPRTLQGSSAAQWEFGPGPAPQRGGSLKTVTTNLTGGWLRRNGVPYSADTVVTEYWDQFAGPGGEYFTVNTIVEDPKYLTRPYITSSQFRKEPDGSKWRPAPCRNIT